MRGLVALVDEPNRRLLESIESTSASAFAAAPALADVRVGRGVVLVISEGSVWIALSRVRSSRPFDSPTAERIVASA